MYCLGIDHSMTILWAVSGICVYTHALPLKWAWPGGGGRMNQTGRGRSVLGTVQKSWRARQLTMGKSNKTTSQEHSHKASRLTSFLTTLPPVLWSAGLSPGFWSMPGWRPQEDLSRAVFSAKNMFVPQFYVHQAPSHHSSLVWDAFPEHPFQTSPCLPCLRPNSSFDFLHCVSQSPKLCYFCI